MSHLSSSGQIEHLCRCSLLLLSPHQAHLRIHLGPFLIIFVFLVVLQISGGKEGLNEDISFVGENVCFWGEDSTNISFTVYSSFDLLNNEICNGDQDSRCSENKSLIQVVKRKCENKKNAHVAVKLLFCLSHFSCIFFG